MKIKAGQPIDPEKWEWPELDSGRFDAEAEEYILEEWLILLAAIFVILISFLIAIFYVVTLRL